MNDMGMLKTFVESYLSKMSSWFDWSMIIDRLRLPRRSGQINQDGAAIKQSELPLRTSSYIEKYAPKQETSRTHMKHEGWIETEVVRGRAAFCICHKPEKSDATVLEEIKQILPDSPSITDSINLRDCGAYNLLQTAIMHHCPLVVKYLISQGADLNMPICGRPLHMAAKLGDVHILKVLLDSGADPSVMSGVCYPGHHHEFAKTVYDSKTETWSLRCPGDIYCEENAEMVHFDYPLYYAIWCDSLPCVELLLKAGYSDLNVECSPLHLACIKGSEETMKYFAENRPELVNDVDASGFSPLQYAVKWGRVFVEYLVRKGASGMVKTNKNETLIHLLIKKLNSPLILSDSLGYLLDCGLHLSVNGVDSNGNTALHLLLQLLHGPEIRQQLELLGIQQCLKDVYREVVKSVEMLLHAKANPNICNKDGERVLHILAQINNVPFDIIFQVLRLLVQHRANVNLVNKAEQTVLSLFITYGCPTLFGRSVRSLSQICYMEVNRFIDCIELLHAYGCKFEGPRYNSKNCLMHSILEHLDKLQHISRCYFVDAESRIHLSTSLMSYIMQIVECMLKCGYPANSCWSDQSDLHCLYYKLIAVANCIPFSVFRDHLLIMFQYGANANVGAIHVPMSVLAVQSAPMAPVRVFPLLHVLNLLLTGRCAFSDSQLMVVFNIFYSSMVHQEAHQCINHYLEYDRHQLNRNTEAAHLDRTLRYLLHNPLSLKHACAYTVYESLSRKLRNVDALILPRPLKLYLKSLEFNQKI